MLVFPAIQKNCLAYFVPQEVNQIAARLRASFKWRGEICRKKKKKKGSHAPEFWRKSYLFVH